MLDIESDMVSVLMKLIDYMGVFLLGHRIKRNILLILGGRVY